MAGFGTDRKNAYSHDAVGAEKHAGTDPLAPIVVNRPARSVAGPFKVVVFNGRGCGESEAIAERLSRPPLAGATVVLLCEVDRGLRRSGVRDCAAEVASRLSMSSAFAPEFGFARPQTDPTSFFGNAILSALPLDRIERVPLPVYYDWSIRRLRGTKRGLRRLGQRGGMAASIRLDGRTVTVGVAHLENRVGPEGRANQLAQLLRALPPDGPAVIGGDFNTTTINLIDWRECARLLARMVVEPRRLRSPEPYEPLFQELRCAGFEYREANALLAPTFTKSGLVPSFMRPKLDWIAYRDLKPVPGSSRVISAGRGLFRRLSDHDFVVCEFE